MADERVDSSSFVPTSVHLARMLDRADGPRVSVAWLMEQLGERSFGLTLFVMALLALLPGASTVMGVLVAWPAIQMSLGHDVAALPGLVKRRQVPVDTLAKLLRLVLPRLERVERLVRPRWPVLFRGTRRLTGIAMLLLGLTLISPVPFGQVAPALVMMLLALALLERDGAALAVGLVAAVASLAATGVTVWGLVETVDWIDPAAHG